MTTGIEVFDLILTLITDLGKHLDADSVHANYIAHVTEYQNARLGTDEYADYYLYRPGQSGTDRVKKTGNLDQTNGFLYVTSGGNYTTPTSDTDYMRLGIDPDIVWNAIANGHARLSTRTMQPLITIADGDMRTSGVNYWDTTLDGAVSNCTPTKVTDPANVFSQSQSLGLTFSGAGYQRGPTLSVPPGSTIWTAFRTKAAASNLTFNMWDKTNSALLGGTAPVASMRDWGVYWRQDAVPANCFQVQPQFNAAGASTHYVDCVWGPYVQGKKRFVLPTDLEEAWQIELIRPTIYDTPIPNTLNGWLASSKESAGDLVPPAPGRNGDFTLEINRLDANPYVLNFLKAPFGNAHEYPMGPIDLATNRLVNTTETFDSPTSSSALPVVQLADFAMDELLSTAAFKDDANFNAMRAEYSAKCALQVLMRPPAARVEQHVTRRYVV